jgi:hypothetical protein
VFDSFSRQSAVIAEAVFTWRRLASILLAALAENRCWFEANLLENALVDSAK